MRKALYGVVLTAPFFSLLLVLMGYPLLYNIYLSFYKLNIISSPEKIFVGLANYEYILSDIVFQVSLENTLIFTFLSVGLEFLLGLVVAVLLSRIDRGRKILTTIFMAPLMIASVVGAIMWRFLYDPFFGVFNAMILVPMFGMRVNWLSDSNIALYSVTIADVWKMWPFFAIIFLAGIVSIPSERLESIRVDGASGWQEFRLVVFPHLLPLIFLAVVIRTIDAFTKVFDVVYMLTGGGPGFATQMLPLLLFRKALRSFRWGEAATLAVIALIISSIFYIVYNWIVKRR